MIAHHVGFALFFFELNSEVLFCRNFCNEDLRKIRGIK